MRWFSLFHGLPELLACFEIHRRLRQLAEQRIRFLFLLQRLIEQSGCLLQPRVGPPNSSASRTALFRNARVTRRRSGLATSAIFF